jgi:hypothetical protein
MRLLRGRFSADTVSPKARQYRHRHIRYIAIQMRGRTLSGKAAQLSGPMGKVLIESLPGGTTRDGLIRPRATRFRKIASSRSAQAPACALHIILP